MYLTLHRTTLTSGDFVSSYLWVCALQANSKTLKHRVEREWEEEHEGAKGGVSLKVHMDMMAAALQIRTWSMAVSVSISVVLYEGRPLLLSPSSVPTVQDNPLQYEDHEEARGHDELWERETGLFETDGERLMSLRISLIKSRIRKQRLLNTVCLTYMVRCNLYIVCMI